MVTEEYLTPKQYVIQRGSGFVGLVTKLLVQDSSGNTLLTAGLKNINQRTLTDESGRQVGRIARKILTMHHEVDFYDESDLQIGTLKMPMVLLLRATFTLEDQTGNPIAKAIGDFMGFEYRITDSQDKQIALITRQLSGGLKDVLKEGFKSAYQIDILSEVPNKLLLLEFIIAIDDYAMAQGNQSNRGRGVTFRL